MRRKTRIAIVANYFAVLCMLLFNSWLILNHGHEPENSLLLQNNIHSQGKVLLGSIHCHDTSDNAPLYEGHSEWQYSFTQCLICIFYQGNFTGTDTHSSSHLNLPETFRAARPEIICRLTPVYSFQLRAPPFQA